MTGEEVGKLADKQQIASAGSSRLESDQVDLDLDLIDGVQRVFQERLEDVFENSNKLYLKLELRPQSQSKVDGRDPILQPLRDKYDLDQVIHVLTDKGSPAFCIGIVKNQLDVDRKESQGQRQLLVATDRGEAILTIKQSGFMGARYEISGAGILEFNLRRTVFGSYVAFDKWKTLFKIHSWWLALTPSCCLSRQRVATVNIRNLDGTWTGAMAYSVPNPAPAAVSPEGGDRPELESESTCFTSVTFAPGLNRKAKYIMFTACLIPLTSRLILPSKG